MPNMSNADPSYIFAMFKGEPGTRKSTQALSFPKPQYWFSWDRKMESGLMVPMFNWGIDSTQIEYDDYDDWSKAEEKLKKFRVNCPFNTLVFDSVTSCADMALRQVLPGGGKNIVGINVNTIEDFNAESSALQSLISYTKDIQQYKKLLGQPMNIILIAHVVQAEYRNTVKPSDTHISRSIVVAAKKTAAKFPAYCGEVYHFTMKGQLDADTPKKYSLLTRHDGTDFARTGLDLEREIVFEDQQLYMNWIQPAIEKLKKRSKQEPVTSLRK